MTMHALTLSRPWDAAILHLGKPVENRKWRPGDKHRDTRIALHSGQSWDALAIPFIQRCSQVAPDETDRRIAESRDRGLGSIVGTVLLLGWWRVDEIPPNPWAFGPWCWALGEVFVLPEPVPCAGALGLWTLPANVEAKVLEQGGA